MQGVRQAESIYEEIRALQDLLQDACSPGSYSRSDKIELVGVWNVN